MVSKAIVGVVLVVALLAGGYFFMSFRGGGSPLSALPGVTPRVSEKDFEFITDPVMRKHFVAQANATAFRTKTDSSGKGTVDTTEVQMQGDQFRWRSTVNDKGKDISDAIYIGDTTYIKDFSDNKWWKQTIKPEKTTQTQKATENKPIDIKEEVDKEKDKLNFKALGKEACGNMMCYKYEISFGSDSGKQTVWFDDQKYLTRREESSFGEFKTAVEYSYDNINVSPPTPTKDVPEGKNIFEFLYSAPTGRTGLPQQVQPPAPEENP